jgi:hypothetical protein
VVRAEFPRERFLIFSSRDADRSKAHLPGKLNPEMPESTQPEHSNNIARPSPTIPETIERRDAGAHHTNNSSGTEAMASAGAIM